MTPSPFNYESNVLGERCLVCMAGGVEKDAKIFRTATIMEYRVSVLPDGSLQHKHVVKVDESMDTFLLDLAKEESDENFGWMRNSRGRATKYEDYQWKDLPLSIKRACIELGCDEQIWNKRIPLEVEEHGWYGLSQEQQGALGVLGWDAESWDHQYSHTSWKNLPVTVQKAALSLGFTPVLWKHHDHDHEHSMPKGLVARWSDLTRDQQLSLHVLGYVERSWNKKLGYPMEDMPHWPSEKKEIKQMVVVGDGHSNHSHNDEAEIEVEAENENASSHTSSFSSEGDISFVNDWIYQDTAWEDLPEEVRAAAQFFGWDAEMWDDDENPDDADKYWNELNEEQKAAAAVLGYHEELWDRT